MNIPFRCVYFAQAVNGAAQYVHNPSERRLADGDVYAAAGVLNLGAAVKTVCRLKRYAAETSGETCATTSI